MTEVLVQKTLFLTMLLLLMSNLFALPYTMGFAETHQLKQVFDPYIIINPSVHAYNVYEGTLNGGI